MKTLLLTLTAVLFSSSVYAYVVTPPAGAAAQTGKREAVIETGEKPAAAKKDDAAAKAPTHAQTTEALSRAITDVKSNAAAGGATQASNASAEAPKLPSAADIKEGQGPSIMRDMEMPAKDPKQDTKKTTTKKK